MPLNPVTRTLNMPVETTEQVAAVVHQALGLRMEGSRTRREKLRRDIEDHFFYVGAVRPEILRPLQGEIARLPDASRDNFRFTFETWLYLLGGADESCVEHLTKLVDRNPEDDVRRDMLAAIGTPASLHAIARLARRRPTLRAAFERLGIAVDRSGAQERFSRERRAIRVGSKVKSRRSLAKSPHPIGLPVASVMRSDATNVVKWHYLTLTLAHVPGLPALPFERLHLVSPRSFCKWKLSCVVDAEGRYTVESLETDDDETLDGMLDGAEDEVGWAKAELLPYDDELVYTNGHILSSESVVGCTGGPPLSLIDPPCRCPRCDRMPFHVAQVESTVREFGDGFRSLFVCEQCLISMCVACLWN